MASFYIRVEFDFDHLQTDDTGFTHPRVVVQTDGLEMIETRLLDKVRRLINDALQGSPGPSPSGSQPDLSPS